MSARKRIVARNTEASVTRVLRTRKGAAPASTSGAVVEIEEDGLVLGLLKKAPVSMDKFRDGEYLHVSDLLGKCMRKIALTEAFNLSMPSKFIHEAMALTFAQGVALHDHVKGRMVAGHGDNMYGSWSCKCGAVHVGPTLLKSVKPKVCDVCDTPVTRYHELELRDPDLMVIGSPDITIYLPKHDVYYPIEIKSIKHEEWDALNRAKPDHVLQVLFYWYLLKKLGYRVPSQISVLYVSKGFMFKSPYKEFLVYPEKNISRLDDYLEEARALKAARSGGEIPPRSFCTSRECREAKDCHVVNLCFQHK